MKNWKLFVAYALFSLCLIVVCLWSITQDYEYEANREVVEITKIVEVNQDVIDLVLYVHEVGKQEITYRDSVAIDSTVVYKMK